ncbi:MAG TPA: FtsQ-type POTRA domain-containing protein [Polyangiaceae bacterium]|nr:FtsQ-type POTRA domain-containing protein [Polyangiaceae bacterium]
MSPKALAPVTKSTVKPGSKGNRYLPPPPPVRPSLASRFARAVTPAAKLGLGVVLVLGTAGATSVGAYRLALGSSHFAVRHVELEASQRVTESDVLETAGVALGDNLLALDTRAAEQRLLADSWNRSARVTRKLPSTLRVQLVEREALALASLDGSLFLVEASGEPFKAWQEGDPKDFPVLTGVTLEALAKDRAGAVARLATGLSVLSHYERLPVSQQHHAQEVNLAPDGSVVLTVGARGVALHLGQGPWPKKMLMVAEVMRTFEKRELPGVVFLDNALHPERVVVRMR